MKKQQHNELNTQLKIVDKNTSTVQCKHCGSFDFVITGFDENTKKRICHCEKCNEYFLEKKYNKFSNNRPLSKDVWDVRKLGLKATSHRSENKLIFSNIRQDWLKEIVKKFIRYKASHCSTGTLKTYISSLNSFSDFIFDEYKNHRTKLTLEKLTRYRIIQYLYYLNEQGLSPGTKSVRISNLKMFLETAKQNSWAKIRPYLIRPEDYPKRVKNAPRFIPEEVMKQLNQNLDLLPLPVMRGVLVLQETGLRIGELLQLSFNCINQDNSGDWFLDYMKWKQNTEDRKPISIEIARVIQEQQQFIREHFLDYEHLFCARARGSTGLEYVPSPKIMLSKSFIDYLKNLAKKKNICDNSGKAWNFQNHEFRHTVGTRMINNGVPQHIVQRFLGHESPEMTMHYAHIYDQTLKKEIAKYHNNRVVNITGEIIESSDLELDNNLDLHLLKKKVLTQALSNGSCARPIVLGDCPHANACLTCGDFRTTIEFLEQHKIQLEETERIIKKAKEKGWERQEEMNKKVANNLKNIINSLEFEEKNIVSGME